MRVLACIVELVNGECPEGQTGWVEVPAGNGFDFVTPDLISPLLGKIIIMWAVAYGVRMVVRAIRGG